MWTRIKDKKPKVKKHYLVYYIDDMHEVYARWDGSNFYVPASDGMGDHQIDTPYFWFDAHVPSLTDEEIRYIDETKKREAAVRIEKEERELREQADNKERWFGVLVKKR